MKLKKREKLQRGNMHKLKYAHTLRGLVNFISAVLVSILCISCILFFNTLCTPSLLLFSFYFMHSIPVLRLFYVNHCAYNFFVYLISLVLRTLSCIFLYERCYTNKVLYYYYYYYYYYFYNCGRCVRKSFTQ